MGKKSGPKMPAAPDPRATAQAQGEYDVKTAIANANLNRINQYSPEGSVEYTIDGYNPDGTPRYSQHNTYSPDQQAIYQNQTDLTKNYGNLANQQLGRVSDTMNKPFNYDAMTPLVTNVNGGPLQNTFDAGGPIQKSLDYSNLSALPGVGDFSADAKRVSDALYGQATSRLDPQWEQQQRQLATQLAGKGITENSEAYRRAMDQAARQRTDAYNQANWSAIGAGGQEQSRLFGLGLAARQQGQNEVNTQGTFANAAQAQQYAQNQGLADFFNTTQQQGFNQGVTNAGLANAGRQQQISEANYLRNLPIQDIAALMSGQSGNAGLQKPGFEDVSQVNMAPIDYTGMVNNNYNAQMDQYKQKQAARSSALGGLFGLGGAALSAFSDRRLKANLARFGTTSKGIPTYFFNYLGDKVRHFGVMAQDVLKVIPEAVGFKDGFMTVDYGKVW